MGYRKEVVKGATYLRKIPTPETEKRKNVIRRQRSTKMLDIKSDMDAGMAVPLI